MDQKYVKYMGMKIEQVREQFILDYGKSMRLIEFIVDGHRSGFYDEIYNHKCS